MPKNIKDIDMINSHPVILLNSCQQNKLSCNVLKKYVENRNLTLNSFGDDFFLLKTKLSRIYIAIIITKIKR